MSKFLRQIMAAVMMMALVSAGAFAQDKKGKQRPIKEPVKVIDGKGGGSRPPPREQQKPPKEERGKKKP